MAKLKILNTRERKMILNITEDQWGVDFSGIAAENMMMLSSRDKIYLLSKSFEGLDERKLRINSAGLYFGELKGESLRLSVEGSQMIGPESQRNTAELDDNEIMSWLSGEDIMIGEGRKGSMTEGCSGNSFVIIKHRDKATGKHDFFGCGKHMPADEKGSERILNYMPKTRRVPSRG
ncbi:MAG: hypothetical protein R6U32_02190 [Candidatus Woesearchaeota archaeon]